MRQASHMAQAQSSRGAEARSGTPDAKSTASRAGAFAAGALCESRLAPAAATRVDEPPLATRYPSASSCSYAETTSPRETPN